MRFLGKTFQEAEEMTLREYSYEIHAFNLRQKDENRKMHWQAWLNARVYDKENKGTEKKPKMEYVYQDFENFYKESEPDEVEENTKYNQGFLRALAKANEKSIKRGG